MKMQKFQFVYDKQKRTKVCFKKNIYSTPERNYHLASKQILNVYKHIRIIFVYIYYFYFHYKLFWNFLDCSEEYCSEIWTESNSSF